MTIINPIMKITRNIRAHNVKQFIEDNENKRLLDIGCGDGYFLKLFKHLHTFGIDEKQGENVEEGIKFEDNYFDYITMISVIEHIKNYKYVLKECCRVLKDDGKLILTTPKKFTKYISYLYAPLASKRSHIYRYFKKEDFIDLARELHLKLVYSTFEFGLNGIFILKRESY